METMARMLITLGMVLLIVGVLIMFLGKIPGMGKLPGDILIKRENFSFYFPLTTSIIISLILSLVLYLWQQK